jgi:hypothetical protein
MAKAVVPMRAFRDKFGELSGDDIGRKLRDLVQDFLQHEQKDVRNVKSEVGSH